MVGVIISCYDDHFAQSVRAQFEFGESESECLYFAIDSFGCFAIGSFDYFYYVVSFLCFDANS